MEHRTAIGLFLALAGNRPVAALNIRVPVISGAQRALSAGSLVDVDANLLHPDLASDIDHHIQVLFRHRIQDMCYGGCEPVTCVQ